MKNVKLRKLFKQCGIDSWKSINKEVSESEDRFYGSVKLSIFANGTTYGNMYQIFYFDSKFFWCSLCENKRKYYFQFSKKGYEEMKKSIIDVHRRNEHCINIKENENADKN